MLFHRFMVSFLSVFIVTLVATEVCFSDDATNSTQTPVLSKAPTLFKSPVPASAEDSTAVEALVRQLGSPNKASRDSAEAALIEKGQAIMPVVLQYSKRTLPAEVLQRLNRITRTLELQAGQAFLKPSTVDNVSDSCDTIEQLVAEIAHHTKNPVSLALISSEERSAPIVLGPEFRSQLVGHSFWEAMDALALNQNWSFVWFQRPKSLKFQPAPGPVTRPPVVYNGPTRLEITEIRQIRRMNVPQESTFQLGLTLAWEPRLKPIYIQLAPAEPAQTEEDIKVESADTITTLTVPESLEILAGDGFAKPLEFTFARSVVETASSTGGFRFRGRYFVITAGPTQTFEFNLATGVNNGISEKRPVFPFSQRIDKAQTIVNSVSRPDSKTVAVQIAIQFDESHNALRSYMNWLNNNTAEIVTSTGRTQAYRDWETVWQGDRGAEFKYYFDLPPEEKVNRIRYTSPTSIQKIEYPFEFNNLNL